MTVNVEECPCSYKVYIYVYKDELQHLRNISATYFQMAEQNINCRIEKAKTGKMLTTSDFRRRA